MYSFELFKNAVKNAYLENKRLGRLNDKLNKPSPANLRDYSLIRCMQNLSVADLNTFKSYFDPLGKYDSIEQAIRKVDLGQLKSLQNFITGETSNPSDDIVKILAILLDFPKRPYKETDWIENEKPVDATPPMLSQSSKTLIPENNIHIVSETKESSEVEVPDLDNKIRFRTAFQSWKIFIYSAAIISLIFGIVIFYSMTNKECMCWNGERYIEIDCKDKGQSNAILPLDEEKLNSFQKIMSTDTLNETHIGKIWYSKINHEVEFFTKPGFHPIKNDRSLKAVTAHIIKKYALHTDSIHP